MTYTTTVTSKGQITLPVKVRRELNIKTGDRVSVTKKGKDYIIQPDMYEEELAALRKRIEKHLKANGKWGVPFEVARAEADKVRVEEYRKKYGLRP